MLATTSNWLQHNKRLFIITVICIALAANFWAGSRVPSLNDKASLGGALILEDPLGFEAAYPVDPGDPVLEKIYYTTVNWVLTNRRGMTFGILIAAGFMTMLTLLKRRSFSSHFGNTLLGLFIGMPLGVCVNCAAPIARGLHESGMRLETTLVTMISSPTLNIIVLTMLFSLMPIYMAITKVVMTLFFLLVLVPLLARYVFNDQLVTQNISLPDDRPFTDNDNLCEIPSAEPDWLRSITWAAKKYASNLLYIIRLTLPLMLLAGLMGAIAITLFPWQQMTELFVDNQWYLMALGVILIAAVGLFLPVPIAFDVAIVTALLAAGIPAIYAMTLLFTLGIFSVYSFFIVWTGISKKVALVLSGILLSMGILSGIVVDLYLKWDEANQQKLFEEFDLGIDSNSISHFFIRDAEAGTLPDVATSTPAITFHSGDSTLHVTEIKMQKPSPRADKLFTRHYGEEFGLAPETDMTVSYKFIAPFAEAWPVASADINADGWIDIVFGTEKGLFLYKNIQGKHFEKLPLTFSNKKLKIVNIALIDLNNDSLPDLYLSLFRRGNHIIYNTNGSFQKENLVSLPDMGSTIIHATAFGDLDLDGDIDIVAGNWTAGPATRQPGEKSRNAILWNKDGEYKAERLPGLPGETLSILISDINQDSLPDLMVTNDFQMPESYYLGQPDGKLKLIKRSDKIFPVTTFSTMSIDSGDIDNDLSFEIYATQASGFTSTNPTKRAAMLPLQSIDVTCDEYENNNWKKRCLTRLKQHKIIFEAWQKRNPHHCLEIKDAVAKKRCIAYLLLEKATRFDKKPELCRQFKKGWDTLAYICNQGNKAPPQYSKQQVDETLKQVLGRNILYKPTRNGTYQELAEDMDIDITGWSWSAKFADLDNDEWQDIYVVNGRYLLNKRATNVFFRNQQGKRFSNDTRKAGLENYLAMSAYTYIDYDNDTDLDIIAVSFDGPIWVYTNNTQKNQGIIFELDDKKGNRTGIGSRIIIHYGDNGNKHQIREIKASGGFASFDAPIAHFGLGKHKIVSRVEVIWSTGEKTELKSKFKAGHKYRIERAGS